MHNSQDFDLFCKRMLPRATALAYGIARSHEDAEDIAVEALARAYRRWKRLSRVAWRDGWVLKVAANLALDQVRKMPVPAVEAEIPHSSEARVEDRELLLAAVPALPRRQQEAIVMFYLFDLSYAEIARAMKVSVGSVKRHLHRGLENLRTVMDVKSLEGVANRDRASA